MPAWAIAFIVIGCLAVFAIVVGLIARSRSQQLGESEAEKEVARNKAGNHAELLVNNEIQAIIIHELDGHGVNHRKFIFFTNRKE